MEQVNAPLSTGVVPSDSSVPLPDISDHAYWNILVIETDGRIFEYAQSHLENVSIESACLRLFHSPEPGAALSTITTLPELALVILAIEDENYVAYAELTSMLRENAGTRSTRIIVGADHQEGGSAVDITSNFHLDDFRSTNELTSPLLSVIVTSQIRSFSLSKELHQARREIDYQVRQRTEEILESKEAAEYNLRQRSDMLAHITHDLRSPLGGILGLSQMLTMGGSQEEQQEICNTISDSCEHLLDLVNNVLDFSKIESGEFTITKARFNLRDCVESVIQLMMPLATQKHISLNLSFGFNVPEVINGDATRMKQILQNLIGNAIKFTDSGEVRLRVTAQKAKVESTLTLYITDTGTGIAPDEQKLIFERYKQAEGDQNDAGSGCGLGLFITKHLVTVMGGTINLHSELGKGTTFAIRLPLETLLGADTAIGGNGVQDGVSINLMDGTTAETLRRKLISWGFTIRENARPYTQNEPSEERTVAIFDQATFTRVLNSTMAADLNRYLGIIWVKTAEIPQNMLDVLTIPIRTLLLPLRTLAIAETCDELLGSSHRKHLSQSEYSSIWPSLSLRLLLLDENPIDRQLMQIFLQKLKCNVKSLGNLEGIDQIEHIERYDAIIISKELIIKRPALPDRPIIICSDIPLAEEEAHELSPYLDGILEKPVQPSKLIPLLDHFIIRNQLGKTQTFSIH